MDRSLGDSGQLLSIPSRVGPYSSLSSLIRAPGVTLLRGKNEAGEEILVQVLQCRAPSSSGDASELKDYVHGLRIATEHLSNDREVVLLGHGAVRDVQGGTFVYWAMPWGPEFELVGQATHRIRSGEAVAGLLQVLLDRLDRRHVRGRLDPLLSEDLLLVRENGEVLVLGFPVPVDPRWLVPGARPPRLAPEEKERGEPARAGDFWRLGALLRGLLPAVADASAALLRAVSLLSDPQAHARCTDTARVRALFHLEPMALGGPKREPSGEAALTIPMEALGRPKAQVRAPFPDPSVEISEMRVLGFDSAQVSGDIPIEIDEASAPTQAPEVPKPKSHWPSPVEQDSQTPASIERDTEPDRPAMSLGALGPGGTVIAAGLPRLVPPGLLPQRANPAGQEPASALDGLQAPVPKSANATPGATVARVPVLGSLVLVLLGGALGFLGARLTSPKEPSQAIVVGTSSFDTGRQVTVEIDTPNVTAVGEADGSILGGERLRFLTPNDGEVPILLAAGGFKPQRLVLPDRGGVRASLEAEGSSRPCTLRLRSPTNVGLEGVGFELGSGPSHEVPALAVVRSTQGAWIVECGARSSGDEALPTRPLQRLVLLRVSGPERAKIFIDGELAGRTKIEKHVSSGFRRVRFELDDVPEEFWVPVFRHSELSATGLFSPKAVESAPP